MTSGGHHRFMTELIRRSADGENLEIFALDRHAAPRARPD